MTVAGAALRRVRLNVRRVCPRAPACEYRSRRLVGVDRHDAYLRNFEAAVSDLTTVNGQPAVALSASAFYPTGGGQPCDTGLLNGVAVTDVIAAGEFRDVDSKARW